MSKIVNISGQKYGLLTAIKIDHSKSMKHGAHWLCRCDCGNYISRKGCDLKAGRYTSCGCNRKNTSKKFAHYSNDSIRRHLYDVYTNMKKRCYNPSNKSYKYYGGKGINICDDWKQSFSNFYNWSISAGYSEGLSIERIDISKGYSPENCTWISMSDQQQNKSNLIYLSHDGITMNLSQWCKKTGISYSTVQYRRRKLISQNEEISFENLFY